MELLGPVVSLYFISNDQFFEGFFFKSHFTILLECVKVLVVLDACTYFVLSVSVIQAIPVFVKWYLSVVLICSSLLTNEVEKKLSTFYLLHSISSSMR